MLSKVRSTETEMREFAEVFAYYDYGMARALGFRNFNDIIKKNETY